MVLVADYSFARPPVAALAQHYEGVMRYVLGSSDKWLSIQEAAALHAAGLTVGIVAEGGAGDLLGGAAKGAAQGQLADAMATARGFPKDRPIYYASDTDVQDSQWPQVGIYLDAARVSSGRPSQGIYGGAGLVQWCLDHGHAEFGWVAAASSWNHGHSAPGAHLRQKTSAAVPGCDDNDMLAADWGQWPGPAGTPPTQEDPMDHGTLVTAPAGHPHAGETWLALGLQRVYVPTPSLVGVYKFVGAGFDQATGGPVVLSGEWFDNLVPIAETHAFVLSLLAGNYGEVEPGGPDPSPYMGGDLRWLDNHLKAALASLPAGQGGPLSDADVARIATAVLDEQHRRDES